LKETIGSEKEKRKDFTRIFSILQNFVPQDLPNLQVRHEKEHFVKYILAKFHDMAGVSLLGGQAEGVGAVQPGEEKAPG